MGAVGMLFVGIGSIVMLIFGVILLVKAFQTSVLWGLGYLFVPFVALIFVIMHWDDTKKPFLYSLVGFVVCVVGIALGGAGADLTALN
jgi:hypothetical protein